MNDQQNPPELTLEDMATFKRCRSESFWRGCIPMMIGAGLAVGFAQSRGFFVSRPRIVLPTYFLAGLTGYFGGKLSYVGKCKRMFLELNDSRVKDFLEGNQQHRPRMNSDPVIVETPIGDEEMITKSGQLMTYAQRREFYRNRRSPDVASPSPQPPSSLPPSTDQTESFISPSPNSLSPSSSADYFDQERPLSSFLFEDSYAPKE